MADETTKEDAKKPLDETAAQSRNRGKGEPGYDEKNPNAQDIHSDDPLVAGLANGTRQSPGHEDEAKAGTVQ